MVGASRQNAGLVIGGSRPSDNVVAPLALGRKPLRDLVVYELHLDDFTDEYRGPSPTRCGREKLDYLRHLGVNAILCMPWTTGRSRVRLGLRAVPVLCGGDRYANDWTIRRRSCPGSSA